MSLYFASTVATLGALSAGLAFGFSSACSLQISSFSSIMMLFASCLNMGGMIGGLLSSPSLLMYGRKYTLLISLLLSCVGWLCIYSSFLLNELEIITVLLMFGRFLTGIGCGMSITASATYLIEISPPHRRNLIGSLTQVGIVVGIDVAFLMAIYLSWNVIALYNSLFVTLLILCTCYLHDSPKWLKIIGRTRDADLANISLYGSDFLVLHHERDDDEISNVRFSCMSYICPCLSIPSQLKPQLKIAITLNVLQQLTGINVILYFAQSVCLTVDTDSPSVCAFLIGLVQIVSTLLVLIIIDRVKRTTLLKWSSRIMAVAYFIIACNIMINLDGISSQFWIYLFIFGFSIGWGTLPVLITTELFPTSCRGMGLSAAVAMNWLSGFVVVRLSEALNNIIEPHVMFIAFGLLCLLSLFYVHNYVPDTRSTMSNSAINK